jgi:hypothetical protein
VTLSVVSTLLPIALVAAISPVLAECTGRLAIPAVVLARTLRQRAGQPAHVPGLGFHPVSG